MKRPIKINLQLFAEGAPEGQAPTTAEQIGTIFDGGSDVAPVIEPPVQPAASEPIQPPQAPVEPKPAESTPPTADQLILGKFKNTEEVFKGYRNLESSLTKTFMDKSNLSKENAALKAQLQELQSKPIQPIIPQVPAQPQVQEPVNIDPEETLAGFYKDPIPGKKAFETELIQKVLSEVDKRFSSQVTSVTQKIEAQEVQGHWSNAFAEFASKTADFDQYLETMSEYMTNTGLGNEKDPEKISRIISDAYRWAKGGVALQPQPVPINPDDLLKDETFVSKILSNQDITQKIINQHMVNIQKNQPPPVIGDGGGAPPASPPERPKDQNDAAKLAGAIYDGNFG